MEEAYAFSGDSSGKESLIYSPLQIFFGDLRILDMRRKEQRTMSGLDLALNVLTHKEQEMKSGLEPAFKCLIFSAGPRVIFFAF